MSQVNPHAGTGKSLDGFVVQYATQQTAAIFTVVGVTGVLMFFRLFKSEVEGIHEWLGLTFAAVAIAHVVRNRRSSLYLLKQARMRVLFLIIVLGSLGFVALMPSPQTNPFRQATQRMLAAPINDVAPVLGMSPDDVITRLRTVMAAQGKS